MGRRMFDEGEVGWPDPPPFRAPVFVLTNHAREPWVSQGGTTFTFVTDGIESALEQAKAAAGDKDILIAGGANTVRQFLEAGLLDELQIHLAPVLLGDGQVVRPCGPGAYRVRAHAGDRLAQGHASQVSRRGKRKRRSRCLTLRRVASSTARSCPSMGVGFGVRSRRSVSPENPEVAVTRYRSRDD
jgi:dihydrofolate reductase